MAEAVSYDSGQYTGWDDSGGSPATSAAEADWDIWAAETTTASTQDQEEWTPTASTTLTTEAWTEQAEWTSTAAWTSSTTTPAWSASSTTSWTAVPTSSSTTAGVSPSSSWTTTWTSATPSSSVSAQTSSTMASSSASSSLVVSSSTTDTDRSATVSRYSNPSQAALAASGSDSDGGSSFKITYLIPVFVGLPIIAIFAIASCTYGTWWGPGKSRRNHTPYTDASGGAGAWWGGAGAAGAGSWSGGKNGIDPEQDAEEHGGLVEGKWVGDSDVYDEKDGASPSKGATASRNAPSRWSNAFGSVRPTGQYKDQPDVPFLTMSQAPLAQQDAPFDPPPRSSSTHDFLARGEIAPQGGNGQHRSAGPWSSSQQRWNMRSGSVRSTTSRLSDKIRARFGVGQAARDDCPSPSVYSPEIGNGNMATAGAYIGLHTALEEDEDLLQHEKMDYDAILAAARVGHSDLARKYTRGEVTDEQLFPARPEGQHELPEHDARACYYARQGFAAPTQPGPFAQPYRDDPPAFAVDLPSSPSRLQVSPKKSAIVLSRAAPDTPERTASGMGDLLFSYESPVRSQQPPTVSSAQRRPLPTAPRAASTREVTAPLTDTPARIPFRQQPPPQLSRRTHLPPALAAAHMDVFGAPGPSAAAASADQRGHVTATVGSPMPAFEPATFRARDLRYSIEGVDQLIFDPALAPSTAPQQGDGRKSPTKQPNSGALRELASQARAPSSTSRNDSRPSEQQSTSDVQPGMIVPSSVALQASKAPKMSSREGSSPAKERPVSAYANLPRQTQDPRPQPAQRAVSKVASRQDLRPTEQRDSKQQQDSLGFEPSFGEGPVIPRLQHPSKVRAAIENIETREPASAKSAQQEPHHRKTASQDSMASRSMQAFGKTTVTDAPPQTMQRSTDAGPTTYRRALGRKGLDTDSDESDQDDEEAIATKRRLSTLILNRSKSQSGALASNSGGDSSPEPTSFENETRRERPLSSDPRRLSMMLRRGSSGANLAFHDDEQ